VQDLEQFPKVFLQTGDCFLGIRPTLVSTVLGSCVAVTMCDPGSAIGAICHAFLPDSVTFRHSGSDPQVCRYVDTALENMFSSLMKLRINPDNLSIKVFGGATGLMGGIERTNLYDIGGRNIQAVRRWLWEHGLAVSRSQPWTWMFCAANPLMMAVPMFPTPMKPTLAFMVLAHQFQGAEEVGHFDQGGLGRVGAVAGVGLDALAEVLPNGAVGGLGRVGGAHEVAVAGDGVFAFEAGDDHRAGDHVLNQVLEEGAGAVHGVKAFSLGAGQLDHLHGLHSEACVEDHLQDGAGLFGGNGVGLDDGEGALSHLCVLRGKK